MTGWFNHHKFLQDSLLRRLEEQLKRVEETVDDIWSETRDVPGKNDACRGRAQLLRAETWSPTRVGISWSDTHSAQTLTPFQN